MDRVLTRRGFQMGWALAQSGEGYAMGSRRELFVDRERIESMRGAELRLATPVDAGPVLRFDRSWEGRFSGYTTMLRDGDVVRAYYRGSPAAGADGQPSEVTCYAESRDGVTFTKPEKNIVLEGQAPFSHNFCPLLDASRGPRYKAVAGIHKSGLHAFGSDDGLRWRRLQAGPVLPSPKEFVFDSQNLAFWSEAEKRYVLYYRSWHKIGATGYRWVSRAVSDDFLNWRVEGEMDYGDAPPEHLYTNQTAAYFRAPEIYVGICARFFPGRQVLSEEQARAVGVDAKYFKDCSDAVLVTSRGGRRFHRTFLEAFVRPGLGLENWVSRSNYPALGLVQTSASAMSFYVNRNYGQPTAYLRRYELRLDGFASAHAGYRGGELITKPFTYAGTRLELNYATSAAGSVRVTLETAAGERLAESRELIGDEIAQAGAFAGSLGEWQGRAVRLRFAIRDGDVFSYRFV